MLSRKTWDGWRYSTHSESKITHAHIADYVRAVVGRIAKNRIMYRDEYAAIALRLAEKFAKRNGVHTTIKALDITSEGKPRISCGYGRVLSSGLFEMSAAECDFRREDGESCLIENNAHLPLFFRSVAHYRRFNISAYDAAGGMYSKPKVLRCETCGVIGSSRWVNYSNCNQRAYHVDGVEFEDLPEIQCLGCGSKSRSILKRLRDIHENGVSIRRIQRAISHERKKQREQAHQNDRGHEGVSC